MPFSHSLMLSVILASAQYATALRIGISYSGPAKTPHEVLDEETYAQYLECGGETYMLSRVEASDVEEHGWLTRVRKLEGNKFKITGTYATSMSHNLASLCVDGQILLMGGQWRSEELRQIPEFPAMAEAPHWNGIQQVLLPNLKQPLDEVQPTVATTGDVSTTDCIEGRPIFAGSCEFDGKISLSRKKGFWGSKTYMYARANIDRGKRWVQMAQSSNNKDWSKFKPIEIEGLNRVEARTNVYFFNVEDWNSTHKAGIFPAVLPGKSGIFLTFSKDMITWSRPSLIKKLEAVILAKFPTSKDRVGEYPVALLNRRLLTMKRHTPFNTAFYISDRPIPESPEETDISKLLHFVPFEVEVERGPKVKCEPGYDFDGTNCYERK